jgi:hypothetical protein
MDNRNTENKSSREHNQENNDVCLFCGEASDEQRILLGICDGWRCYPAICNECIGKYSTWLARTNRRSKKAKPPKCAGCGENIDVGCEMVIHLRDTYCD